MTREEVANLMISLIQKIEQDIAAYTETPEFKELQDNYEKASEEEQHQMLENYNNRMMQIVSDNMSNISPSQAKEILSSLSSSLVSEYSIPKSEGWFTDKFTTVAKELIELVKDDTEFCNRLLMNDNFMGLFPYNESLPEALLSYADDKEAIRHFLCLYTENCKSDKEEKSGYTTNRYLMKFVGVILKSDKFDDEYKESLINDPELSPFYVMDDLLKEITGSSFSKEKKLQYLVDDKINVINLPFAPRSKADFISFASNTSPAFLIKLTENRNSLQVLRFA